MRKILLAALILGSLLLFGLALNQLIGSRPDPVPAEGAPVGGAQRITVQQLKQRLASPNPPLVWDQRSPEAFALLRVPGSRQVALGAVAVEAASLDRNQPIVTLCA
jgi:rhodanese-related sulfurtransferase